MPIENTPLSASANLDGNNKIRLNRAIASAGICSRRKADQLIIDGRVRVNGKPQLSPALAVTPADRIEVDGRIIAWGSATVYLMLNKPIHTVSTASDPQHRKTIYDLLPPPYRSLRLFSIGRLDYFSEGLIILTNDGLLAQRLSHPSWHQPKLYEVKIRGEVSAETLRIMADGQELPAAGRLLPCRIESRPAGGGNTFLYMELRQGINRQIRKMCQKENLTILRLRRIAQGCLRLGNLQPGHARELTADEIAALRKSVGL